MDRPVRVSAVRAWVVGHHGIAVLVVLVVVTGAFVVEADLLLPVPGRVQRLPLWQLLPPLLAMVTSVAAENRLPADSSPRCVAARAAWLVAVGAAAAGCTAVVDARGQLPATWPATAVLVVLTFGVAAAGGGSAWVGATGLVWVCAHVRQYAAWGTPWGWPGGPWAAAVALCAVAAAAAYVLDPRRPSAEAFTSP